MTGASISFITAISLSADWNGYWSCTGASASAACSFVQVAGHDRVHAFPGTVLTHRDPARPRPAQALADPEFRAGDPQPHEVHLVSDRSGERKVTGQVGVKASRTPATPAAAAGGSSAGNSLPLASRRSASARLRIESPSPAR